MLVLMLVIVLLVAATVAIHAFGTVFWIRYLSRHYIGADGGVRAHKTLPMVTWSAVWLLMLHLAEVVVWAVFYLLITPVQEIATFEEAVYFSVVTFTTLGYGDVTLADHHWRLLSGAEALNGVLLVGWSTALLFTVVQHCWGSAVRAQGK
jgi:voltage-gated potassium channel